MLPLSPTSRTSSFLFLSAASAASAVPSSSTEKARKYPSKLCRKTDSERSNFSRSHTTDQSIELSAKSIPDFSISPLTRIARSSIMSVGRYWGFKFSRFPDSEFCKISNSAATKPGSKQAESAASYKQTDRTKAPLSWPGLTRRKTTKN